MTPADLLQPQPAPEPSSRSESVTDWLLAAHRLRWDRLHPAVVAVLTARREQGVERYGTELLTHNGRRADLDLVQELVDAVLYAAQTTIERPSVRHTVALASLIALLSDELDALDVQP